MFCLVLWLELLDWLHVSIVTQFRINQKLARQCSVSVCLLVSPSVLQCCQNNNCNKKQHSALSSTLNATQSAKRCVHRHTPLSLSLSLSTRQVFKGTFRRPVLRAVLKEDHTEIVLNTHSTMDITPSQPWRVYWVNNEGYTQSTKKITPSQPWRYT